MIISLQTIGVLVQGDHDAMTAPTQYDQRTEAVALDGSHPNSRDRAGRLIASETTVTESTEEKYAWATSAIGSDDR